MSSNIRFHVLTLFPQMIAEYFKEGVVGRALQKGIFEVHIINLRDFSQDKHRKVDERPFGPKAGTILMLEPLTKAVQSIKSSLQNSLHCWTILLSPQGAVLQQAHLESWKNDWLQFKKDPSHSTLFLDLILVCGRYDGVDQRFIDTEVDFQLSIGSYILSGGELPALVLIDGFMRLFPHVLGNQQSLEQETKFGENGVMRLSPKVYSYPRDAKQGSVPDILLSGHHAQIQAYVKQEQQQVVTNSVPAHLTFKAKS